jgi:ubiquinone/menaquinone biosynthesis C-methylase UbiE
MPLKSPLTFLLVAWIALGTACRNDIPATQERIPADTTTEDLAQDTTAEETSEEGFYADYESTDRLIWQQPEAVIGMLGDLTGKTVADIGAGSGYFTKRLALRAKKVIAIDIDQRFLHLLDSIVTRELPTDIRQRIEPRLAEPHDPHLQAGEVDAVLIVNTYMYMAERQNYLRTLLPAMSKKAKILIVDFKKTPTPIGPPETIRLDAATVARELGEASFHRVTTNEKLLQYQYAVLAQKKD